MPLNEITLRHVLDEIKEMRADNREDFAQVRQQIDGLVSKPDCESCKDQWKEALDTKTDKVVFENTAASVNGKMSKRDFAIASSTIVFLSGVFGLVIVFVAVTSGLIKFMTP